MVPRAERQDRMSALYDDVSLSKRRILFNKLIKVHENFHTLLRTRMAKPRSNLHFLQFQPTLSPRCHVTLPIHLMGQYTYV